MSDERELIPTSSTNKLSPFVIALLCVLCIGTFVIVYSISSAGGSGPILLGALIGMIVVFSSILAAINMRAIRRFMGENNEAVAALARGDRKRAHDVFWAWSERATNPMIAALARHNLGNALIRMGKLRQAAAVLADNDEHHPRALKSLAMYKTSAVDVALAHALLGELAQAEQWMAKAAEREAERHMPHYPANRAFARAVIDCRAGRAADAARSLDEHWNEYETTLTGDSARALRVVRALAHASGDVRNAGVAEKVLSGMRPMYPGELDYLATAWPEMATFLAAHQLAT